MAAIKKQALEQFNNGSEHWYRHWAIQHVLYTDGIKYLSDNGAAWLIDKIALEKFMTKDEFQVWKCRVDTNKMDITIEDGNNNLLRTTSVDFTDFPLNEIDIWVMDNIILLPSEY